MANYDPDIIQSFADRLYAQARSLVARYTAAFTFFGLVLGFLFYAFMSKTADADTKNAIQWMPWALGGVFGLAGWSFGNERAFGLRLQAQTALCQKKIEENTRRAA